MTTASATTRRQANLAHLLVRAAKDAPEQTAIVAYHRTKGPARANAPRDTIRYADLATRSLKMAAGLRSKGVRQGDRVTVFVRPGIDLIATVYALFALGAVPVLIDPGMGRKQLASCVERMQPRVFIGIPLAHVFRHVVRSAFRTVELAFHVGPSRPFCGTSIEKLVRDAPSDFTPVEVEQDAQAAILFTSGSTGPPKGVVYTHRMLAAQANAVRDLYDFEPGEVDCACLAGFGLFGPALRLTTVFPDMDPTHPGECDPERITNAIHETGATNTFGSPAIWRRVVPWCVEKGVRLPSLKRVLIAGAPVPPHLIEPLLSLLDDSADVHTPYGATESLPVASVSGREVLCRFREQAESGLGTCVGRPTDSVDVRLIEVTDRDISQYKSSLAVTEGTPGEICVAGAMVTEEYAFAPAPTRAAKFRDNDTVFHRMGDIGWRDAEGNLWFCGRKSHRVETRLGRILPVPVENVFNLHPKVHRTALVGVGARGNEEPVLIVELSPGEASSDKLTREILALGESLELPVPIRELRYHPSFPVDVRHNAKIRREDLKRWAEGASA